MGRGFGYSGEKVPVAGKDVEGVSRFGGLVLKTFDDGAKVGSPRVPVGIAPASEDALMEGAESRDPPPSRGLPPLPQGRRLRREGASQASTRTAEGQILCKVLEIRVLSTRCARQSPTGS